MSTRGSKAVAVAVVVVVAAAVVVTFSLTGGGGDDVPGDDPVVQEDRACGAPEKILRRMARGYYPGRSGDVLAVERLPNQFGTRHSGPHPYTQDVPIVLYGPGFIRSAGDVEREVTVADLAPTFAELMEFDEFPERAGNVLEEALLPEDERNGTPKLIVTVVWDGGGNNVFRQWPEAWPELARLMREGTNYENATVGSSPSITPAVHATIGTGAFPRTHGLPDIRMRVGGKIIDAWPGSSPRHLEIETLADLWDRAQGNVPLMGLLARDDWHVGMLGHGSFSEGGDKDIAVLDELGGTEFTTNEDFYTLPDYVLGKVGLAEAIEEVDRGDGELDGEWLGNPLNIDDGKIRYTPAWPPFQTDQIVKILRNEGFGSDEVTDLFYTNYKGSDLAGHEWNMVDPEVRDVLRAQDEELPRLIAALDEVVGEDSYVLAVTGDHGMTPYPRVTGGWSIDTKKLTSDIEREFNPDPDRPLIQSQRGYQMMLNKKRARAVGVTPEQVADFVADYRLKDNVLGDNKALFEERFSDRADEKLYLAAFTPQGLKDALGCAQDRDR